MSSPVTIAHQLQAPAIEVVPAMLVSQVEAAVTEAGALTITDAASYERAAALKRALDSGLDVPGARLVMVEELAMGRGKIA